MYRPEVSEAEVLENPGSHSAGQYRVLSSRQVRGEVALKEEWSQALPGGRASSVYTTTRGASKVMPCGSSASPQVVARQSAAMSR